MKFALTKKCCLNIYIYIYIYMNWLAIESEFVILGFYYLFTALHVFQILSLLREIYSSFYRDDCFDRGVILFISRICVCKCPVRVNCPWKPLVSAVVFMYVYPSMYSVRVYAYIHININTSMYRHTRTRMYFQGRCFFSFLFLSELKLCDNVFISTDT